MDGHYVPNFGMSFQDIETIRKNTSLKLDVHMMMYNPGRYIERYAEFGADIIYIHPYSETIPEYCQVKFRDWSRSQEPFQVYGFCRVSLLELLSLVDYVLVMNVNPGFAGRDYLHFVEPKIEQLLKLRQRYKFHIVIDGGVTWEILERLWKKGVEGFVLGKQILFEKNEDYRTIIQKVRNI